MVHPTAVIHPDAKVHPSVQIGPYAVIDSDVEIGPDCVVGPHVYLTGFTRIGAKNLFHAGAVIGDAPQDLKYAGARTGLQIGDGNVFREHVTIHRSNKVEEDTIIGSNSLLMAHCHVGHNCLVGNNVIIANGALLAGHVTVQDRAFISGNCVIHQFARVGTLAMMQGGSAIGKDLPPFCVARGANRICGLNVIGMRRVGISSAARLEAKRLYRFLFREGRALREALAEAETEFTGEAAKTILSFAATTKRGLCSDRSDRRPAGAESDADEA